MFILTSSKQQAPLPTAPAPPTPPHPTTSLLSCASPCLSHYTANTPLPLSFCTHFSHAIVVDGGSLTLWGDANSMPIPGGGGSGGSNLALVSGEFYLFYLFLLFIVPQEEAIVGGGYSCGDFVLLGSDCCYIHLVFTVVIDSHLCLIYSHLTFTPPPSPGWHGGALLLHTFAHLHFYHTHCHRLYFFYHPHHTTTTTTATTTGLVLWCDY